MAKRKPENHDKPRPEKQASNRRLPPVETRWKKGQTGNPNGRPKGTSITAILRELLAGDDGLKVAQALIDKAKKGSFNHIKETIDRVDGKVTEKTEVVGTMRVEFVDVDPPTLPDARRNRTGEGRQD